MSTPRFEYPATKLERILVLATCKCSVRRRLSAAHVRSCSLHGHYDGIPNERFRRFRTLADCMVHLSSCSTSLMRPVQKVANALNGAATAVDITITISLCTLLAVGRTGFAEYVHSTLFVVLCSTRSHPQYGSNASPTDFHIGQHRPLICHLCVSFCHSGTFLARHFPHTERLPASNWQLVIYPTDLIFTALYYPLCTVYCNTLLASLNARSFIRGGGETRQLNPMSTLVWRPSVAAGADYSDSEETEVQTLSRHPAVNV